MHSLRNRPVTTFNQDIRNPFDAPASSELTSDVADRGATVAIRKQIALFFIAVPILYATWVSLGLGFFVERMQHTFSEWKLDLPWLTMWVLSTYRWWWLVPAILAIGFMFLILRKQPRTSEFVILFLLASLAGALMHATATVALLLPFMAMTISLT